MTSALNLDDLTLPCRGGDWLINKDSDRVAKVKSVYRDSHDGEVLVDLILFTWQGEQTGRESPVMGGPRSYEPACPYEDWQRIERPSFPMALKWIRQDDGNLVARYYSIPRPDGNYKRRKVMHRLGTVRPEADINLAYKIAAEELRTIIRDKGLMGDARDRVLARATELERKAAE